MITTLAVSGMTCNGCVNHVAKALRAVPAVTAVDVSLPTNSARVVHEGPVEELVTAVEKAGYEARVS